MGEALEADSYLGMDYNHPATLYLGAGTQGLWRSTDGGTSWEKRHPIHIGPVAVGLDDPQVLWAGVSRSSLCPAGPQHRWRSHLVLHRAAHRTRAISPILIDPQIHNLVYTVTMNRRSTASLERSFDSIWEAIPAPVNPVSYPPGGYPSRGLALDASTRGLYVGNPNGTLYVSYNAFALNRDDITWQPVHYFGFQPSPLAVGAGPSGGALYVTLNVSPWDYGQPGRTLRSDDGGQTWIPLTIPPPPGCAAHADRHEHGHPALTHAHADRHARGAARHAGGRATRGWSTAASRRARAGPSAATRSWRPTSRRRYTAGRAACAPASRRAAPTC